MARTKKAARKTTFPERKKATTKPVIGVKPIVDNSKAKQRGNRGEKKQSQKATKKNLSQALDSLSAVVALKSKKNNAEDESADGSRKMNIAGIPTLGQSKKRKLDDDSDKKSKNRKKKIDLSTKSMSAKNGEENNNEKPGEPKKKIDNPIKTTAKIRGGADVDKDDKHGKDKKSKKEQAIKPITKQTAANKIPAKDTIAEKQLALQLQKCLEKVRNPNYKGKYREMFMQRVDLRRKQEDMESKITEKLEQLER